MESNPVKELPLFFEGRGEVKLFSFVQVKMANNAYIYEVCDTFGNKWDEVFIRKENARFGNIAYPKSKSFGFWAWTCSTIEKANERFENLTKKGAPN